MRVEGIGLRVEGLGFRIYGSGCRGSGLACRVHLAFRVEGLGLTRRLKLSGGIAARTLGGQGQPYINYTS